MNRFALIVDGRVHEIFEGADLALVGGQLCRLVEGGEPMPLMHADLTFLDVTDVAGAAQGWIVDGATVSAPPEPAPTEGAVDAIRDARLREGFRDPTTGKTIQTRPGTDDAANMTAVGAAAGFAKGTAPEPSFDIITADNSVLTLSATDAFALLNGRCMPWVSATILYANQLKEAIRAGTPPADITAGWPEP